MVFPISLEFENANESRRLLGREHLVLVHPEKTCRDQGHSREESRFLTEDQVDGVEPPLMVDQPALTTYQNFLRLIGGLAESTGEIVIHSK